MAQQEMGQESGVGGWAVGLIVFAAVVMMIMGSFHFIAGFVGLLNDHFYTLDRNYFVKLSPHTWGWVHMISGVIVFFAGIGLLSGAVWARIVGVFVAMASIITNFAFLPWYPVWSLLMMTLAILVIWALVAHGRDVAAE